MGGRNSGVECQLPKLNVVGSSPIARSIFYLKYQFFCGKRQLLNFDSQLWSGLCPLFYFAVIMNSNNQTYRQKIIELVTPVIASEQMELIDVECLRMRSRWLVRIYMDKEGGVTLDDCAAISNQVGDLLDVHDIPPGPYNLEVSSPGLDRPLTRDKDFIQYRGSKVKIRVNEIIEGKRNFRGLLVDFLREGEKETLVVDEGGKRYYIPRENVAKANLEYEI